MTAAPAFPKIPDRWCFFLYACLTGLCLALHNRMVDAPAVEARRAMHEQVLADKAPAPVQYRVLTFYLSEGIQRAARAAGAADPFRGTYLFLRGLFTFLSAFLLHRFLSVYLPPPGALLGTLVSFAWMPFTYINYFMQETDPLNMAVFLLAYGFIRGRKDGRLAALIPAAMLNRETPVLLPLVWLLYRWDEEPPSRIAGKFLLFAAEAFGTYFALRFAFGHHAAYAEFNDLELNLKSANSYVYFLLLFAPMLPPALKGLGERPKFLRRLAAFLPFFFLFHFIIPIFQETRLFLPVFPALIALALTRFAKPPAEVYRAEEAPARSPLAGRGRPLFWTLLAGFLAASLGYLAYLEAAHVGPLKRKEKAEKHFRLGYDSYQKKSYESAAREWEWGLFYDPENFDLHYNLSALYGGTLLDAERARKHLDACRRIFPDNPRLEDLEERIKEIELRREYTVKTGR